VFPGKEASSDTSEKCYLFPSTSMEGKLFAEQRWGKKKPFPANGIKK